ncbi:MAG: cation transporter, partial [Ketobacteraceae bacterium]|nr:cation transporter [Ketobacteraceae bacterium]
MADCGCGTEQAVKLERRTLIALLLINGVMFFAEAILGWIAQSTGLIADSLDMLADASVYGVSLYAVGKGLQQKATAATV